MTHGDGKSNGNGQITSPPTVVGNCVIVGSAIADNAANWDAVMAFTAG
jgi:hypothetical protein